MRILPIVNSDKVALVSDEDYDAASKHSWSLHPASWCTYVKTTVRCGKKVRTILLHRFIAQRIIGRDIKLPKNRDVHHCDSNPFNNIRENLELIGHVTHARCY